MRLMTIIGTRPEIIRLSEVIKACDKAFDNVLVHTGQNWDYTLNEIFFRDLKLRQPDIYLNCAGETLGETIGNIISKSYQAMLEYKPEAVLILGDTNSALAALSAKRLKIPIFHMEAGNRCYDPNVPEEINRKLVDHLSDINLPYTEHSRRNLLMEGLDSKHVFVTGSPIREVLQKHMEDINQSDVLERLSLSAKQYILVSAHREENIDDEAHFFGLMEAINQIAQRYQMPIVYSVHPRSRKFIEKRKFQFHPLVQSMEPFGFLDYNQLQKNAFCVLSDSGTLSEESTILGFPAVLIRTSTERPEVLDKGTMVIGGISFHDILEAVTLVTNFPENKEEIPVVPDYEDSNVSAKVVKLIQSYTKIVNLFVWRKNG